MYNNYIYPDMIKMQHHLYKDKNGISDNSISPFYRPNYF